MNRDKIIEHLTWIKTVLEEKLGSKTGGKKFRGEIKINLKCNDGGITENSIKVEQTILKNKGQN